MLKVENYEDRLHYNSVINFLDKKLEIKRKETEEREVFSKIESVEDAQDEEDDVLLDYNLLACIGLLIAFIVFFWDKGIGYVKI